MSGTKHSKGGSSVRVFISHIGADAELARKIRDLLSGRLNARVFMDQDLSAGGNWEAKLRRELAEADVVVVLLSKGAVGSSWMLQELGAAWAMEKPIIPVTTGGGILNRMRVQLKATPALELGDIGNPEEADQFVGEFQYALAAEWQPH